MLKNYELRAFVDTSVYIKKRENTHNVLMLGWEFPPHKNGGLGVACHGILKALSKLGICIDFALPRKMEIYPIQHNVIFADQINKIDAFRSMNVFHHFSEYKNTFDYYTGKDRYHEFHIPGQHYFVDHHIHLDHISTTLEEQVEQYASDLAKYMLFSRKTYDVIHAHDWLTAPTAMALKDMFGIPFILHIHATEIDRGGVHGNKDIFEIEHEAMKAADTIVCVSHHTKQIICKYYHIPEEKISVIHNGIDTDSFGSHLEENSQSIELVEELVSLQQSGYQFVLFVGRLTYQKGVEFLLQAAQVVKQYNQKVLFLITGRGDQETWLIEETARMGLGDMVLFCGWQDEKTIKALYSVADVFVMPSRSEPFGLVALEAALHNTPVIASKTSGAIEVMAHALEVEHWDIDKMAHYILSLVSYQPLKETISELSRNHSYQLDWVKPAQSMVSLYATFSYADG